MEIAPMSCDAIWKTAAPNAARTPTAVVLSQLLPDGRLGVFKHADRLNKPASRCNVFCTESNTPISAFDCTLQSVEALPHTRRLLESNIQCMIHGIAP
jgi:hypothetical protein